MDCENTEFMANLVKKFKYIDQNKNASNMKSKTATLSRMLGKDTAQSLRLVLSRFELDSAPLLEMLELVAEQLQCKLLLNFISSTFDDAVLVEEQGLLLRFEIPKVNKNHEARLSDIFEIVEKYKETFNIASYAISQASLEQIFNS